MSTATHALQFYKDGLNADAVPTPALAPRHRFVFVVRGAATVDGRTLEPENAAYGSGEMAVRAGPEGAELWRWELVRVSEQPLLAQGGVATDTDQIRVRPEILLSGRSRHTPQ